MTTAHERDISLELGMNVGAIHAIKTPDHRYLFIHNKKGIPNPNLYPVEDGNPDSKVDWLVPVQSIEGELLPILQKYDPAITSDDFISIYRQRIMLEPPAFDAEAKEDLPRYMRIFDTHIRDGKIFTAIQKAVKEGTGLALLSPTQTRDCVNSGVIDENTSAAIINERSNPIVIKDERKYRQVQVSSRCRYALSDRVSSYPEKFSPEQENVLKQLAETIAFKLEWTPPGPAHRLGLEDLELLSRYTINPELVKKLKDNLTKYRVGLFLVKFFEGAAEGGMVYSVLSGLHEKEVDIGIKAVAALGMLATYIAGKITEESAEEAVYKSLSAVLNDIVPSYAQEHRLYDRERTVSEEIHHIATKLARAEKVSPAVFEIGPSALFVNGALALGGEATAAITPAATLVATELTLHFALQQKYPFLKHPLIKYIAPVVSGVLKFAPLFPALFGENFTHAIQEVGLHVAAIGLTTHHLSDQLNASRIMLEGYEALGELREWLETLGVTLATLHLKREHGLTRLLEDSGMIYVSERKMNPKTGKVIPTPETRRYQLLDDAQNEWAPQRRKSAAIESTTRLNGRDLIGSLMKDRIISPAIFFHDYQITMGDTIFLEDSLYLPSGIHELTLPKRKGKTIILKSLADKVAHMRGQALLRTKETDTIVQGVQDEEIVSYFDCTGEDHNNLPDFFQGDRERFKQYRAIWEEYDESYNAVYADLINQQKDEGKRNDMKSIITYFEENGLLDPGEIISFLSKGKLSVSCRSRLWIAYAGWVRSPVILLDNPFEVDPISSEVAADADNIGLYFYYEKSIAEAERLFYTGYPQLFLTQLKERHPTVEINEELNSRLQRVTAIVDFLTDLAGKERRIILFTSARRGDDSHAGYRSFLNKAKGLKNIFTIDEQRHKFSQLAQVGSLLIPRLPKRLQLYPNLKSRSK